MAIVTPFKAWRYNTARVSMDRVVAPPYDIISAAEQEALYARDPHNIIRIELGKGEPGDHDMKNKYTRAKECWNAWIRGTVVRQDAKAGYYLYETDFTHPSSGKRLKRLVVFGLLKLEPFESKIVLPHEKTHAGPKEDRFKLLEATRTNFSAVYGMYQDHKQTVKELRAACAKETPAFSFKLTNDETHTLWPVSEPAKTEMISRMFNTQPILIADGHHRYETALNFKNAEQTRLGNKRSPSSDYVLTGFVEQHDEGLLIFPIHRLIRNITALTAEQVLSRLSPVFAYEKIDEKLLHDIADGSGNGFGLRLGGDNFRLHLKNPKAARAEMPSAKPDCWYELEVAQISHLVLKHLGVREEALENHLEYTKSSREAVEKVANKETALALIVPPIRPDLMRAICVSGELMPQKSTYFFPKLGSGLVMHRHE